MELKVENYLYYQNQFNLKSFLSDCFLLDIKIQPFLFHFGSFLNSNLLRYI